MPIEIDATFWALVALILFLCLIFYLKVPSMALKALDDRSAAISQELDDARTMREEASELLGDYQRKRKEAESEAQEIIKSAQREAELLLEEAHQAQDEYVKRRTLMIEQKIAQSESAAKLEIKSLAVDLAVSAARDILSKKLDESTTSKIFDEDLIELKSRLN